VPDEPPRGSGTQSTRSSGLAAGLLTRAARPSARTSHERSPRRRLLDVRPNTVDDVSGSIGKSSL